MRTYFQKLSNKVKAFRRKNDIDCYKTEKEGLSELIYTALKERGSLNRVQRSQVLQMVVEKWKTEERVNHAEKTKSYLEAEESNDVAKAINLFGIMSKV
jgi:spore cortex formation protein SpoVR/YcgB (stage V sporulation)